MIGRKRGPYKTYLEPDSNVSLPRSTFFKKRCQRLEPLEDSNLSPGVSNNNQGPDGLITTDRPTNDVCNLVDNIINNPCNQLGLDITDSGNKVHATSQSTSSNVSNVFPEEINSDSSTSSANSFSLTSCPNSPQSEYDRNDTLTSHANSDRRSSRDNDFLNELVGVTCNKSKF